MDGPVLRDCLRLQVSIWANPRKSREATESVVNRLLNQMIDHIERENPEVNRIGKVVIDPEQARRVAMRVGARQSVAVGLRGFLKVDQQRQPPRMLPPLGT